MVQLSLHMGVPFHEVRQWSAAELSLYMAEYRREPFGEARGDIRHARELHQQAEVYRDRKKHPQQYRWQDFLPFKSQHAQEPEQGTTDIAAWMREMKARQGGRGK